MMNMTGDVRVLKLMGVLLLLSSSLAFGVCACKGGGGSAGSGGGSTDTTRPTVISSSPGNGATVPETITAITVKFSEDMDVSTITPGTFTISSDGSIPGSVSYDPASRTAFLTLSGSLSSNTTFTATVTTGVKDLSGNALQADYAWSFSTLDTIQPAVVSTIPASDANGVAVNAHIEIDFSELMDPATINASTLIVLAGGNLVAGTISYSGTAARFIFTPSVVLNYNTTYTVTITTGVKDQSGNPISGDYIVSFTTEQNPVDEIITIGEFTVPTAGVPIPPNLPLTNAICTSSPADLRCTDCSITPYRCSSYPRSIAAGPDGNLWFTEECGNKIGKITPDGVITEFPRPNDPSQLIPYDCLASGIGKGLHSITVGGDGNLWFTDSQNNMIWKMNTAGVIIGEYAVTSCPEFAGLGPHGIATGPDGSIWFAHVDCNYIGKIAVATGEMTGKYNISTPSSGTAHLTAGPGNTIWFTEHGATGSVNKIGKIAPDGTITEYPAAGDATTLNVPFEITAGNDGNVWFTERGGNSIGQITPEGIILKYPLAGDSTSLNTPIGITAGSNATIWFTEGASGTIGQISSGGAITRFAVPSGSTGWHITLGPDNNVWFTELTGNRIGKVRIPVP